MILGGVVGEGDGVGGVGGAEGADAITLPSPVPHIGQTLALVGSTRLKYSQLGFGHLFADIGFSIFIWHGL